MRSIGCRRILASFIASVSISSALEMETWKAAKGERGLNEDMMVESPNPVRIAITKTTLQSGAISKTGTLVRIRGILTAPVDGEYQLAVAGDDIARLELSDDATPFRCRPVARLNRWTRPGNWTAHSGQISAPIHLEPDKPRYFEAWCFNDKGEGHLEIGWRVPGNPEIKPIPILTDSATPIVSPYQPDHSDQNDNGLPDAWENQCGLGADSIPVFQAFSDPDGDAINNRLEFIFQTNPLKPNSTPGHVLTQVWAGLNGDDERVRQYPRLTDEHLLHPASASKLTAGAIPVECGAPSIQKLRGYLMPTLGGAYRFRVSGQGRARISMSPDTAVLAKRQLTEGGTAMQGDRIDVANPALFPESQEIQLEAGSSYYFEILFYQERAPTDFRFEWLRPDGVREEVPANLMRSFFFEPGDEDQDDLPDAWEKEQALSVSGKDPGHFAAGDADFDGLTNGDEYLAGSSPLKADTDGDGVSDFIEVKLLGSTPNDPVAPTGAAETIDLFSAKPLTYGWARKEADTYESSKGQPQPYPDTTLPSLVSATGCGSVEWSPVVRQAGFQLVTLDLQVTGNAEHRGNLTQWWIDGIRLPDQFAFAPCMSLQRISFVTPWLECGKHTLRLQLRSRDDLSMVRLFNLQLQPVLSGNPTDQLRSILATQNRFTRGTGDSRISPACIEFRSRNRHLPKLVTGKNRKIVLKSMGVTDAWADVPLPEDGSPLPLTVTAENGGLVCQSTVTWVPTNVLAGGEITIRKGDALRLMASPPENVTGQASVVINGKKRSASSAKPIIHRFAKVGKFHIRGEFQPDDGRSLMNNSLTVTVVGAPPSVEANWARVGVAGHWIDSLPEPFAPDGLDVVRLKWDADKKNLGLFPDQPGDFILPVRAGNDGPIAGTFTLHACEVVCQTKWIPQIWQNSQKRQGKWEVAALVSNPPSGGSIRFVSNNYHNWLPTAGNGKKDVVLPISSATEENVLLFYVSSPTDSQAGFDHNLQLILPDGREL